MGSGLREPPRSGRPRVRVRRGTPSRIPEVSMGSKRSVIALWIALLFAGSILAFMTRGAGPLPDDLALTMWLQERLPPDGLMESSLAYVGRLVWLLPTGFLAFALLGRRWFDALFVLVAAVTR